MAERLPAGPPEVTPRQREVARLVAEGKSNAEIAEALGISLDGAKYHVSELLGRLNLHRREQIGAWYRGTRVPWHRRLRALLGLPVLALVGGGAAAGAVAVVVAVAVLSGGGDTRDEIAPNATVTAAGVRAATDVSFVQSGDLWARSLRGTSTHLGSPHIAVTGDGVIVFGITIGLSRPDVSGAPFASNADPGGGVLQGVGQTDVVIGALRPDGSHLWSKLLGGPGVDTVEDLALTVDGSIVITGVFEETLSLGGPPLTSHGARDAYVAMLDMDGVHRWSQGMGGPGRSYGLEIGVLDDGNLAVLGVFTDAITVGDVLLETTAGPQVFLARVDVGGSVLAAEQLPVEGSPQDIYAAVNGGDLVVAVSQAVETDADESHFSSRVSLFTATGERKWEHVLDGADIQAIALYEEGLLLGGTFIDPIDLGGGTLTPNGWSPGVLPKWEDCFLLKLSSEGEHVWSTRFGDPNSEAIDAIALASDGDVLVAGTFTSSLRIGQAFERVWKQDSGSGGYLARFDADGHPVAVDTMSAESNVGALDGLLAGSATTDADEVLVSGRYFDWVDAGPGTLRTSRWLDFFIARIEAP